MAKLIKAVHVHDPERHRTVLLLPGEEPEPRLAALVTNPDAWEDGILPAAETAEDDGDDAKDTKQAAPAAKKTATAPARGRAAAGEGDSGA